ncbi:protein CURLY FLAG LEAF 1-like [Humulus lupulus]|uniref:protein CURLY FLAG LEAF 1-like n=1 Tax=Humulus lupulus TaxID=3486 RepID=UPI002B40D9F4|nr:protein CURLY FLAG LEAF 1-like [Humulus lupulus]
MEFPELSLAPTQAFVHSNGNNIGLSLESDQSNASRKRKLFQDHHHFLMNTNNIDHHQPPLSVDLQLKDPLPLDWEQCLDLESGEMYYLNRKTLRKSWNWPIQMEQAAAAAALDLELNMSSFSEDHHNRMNGFSDPMIMKRQSSSAGVSSFNNNNNMVALACLNCHLLVILSKSSPSCPNCKYIHSLPSVSHQNCSPAPSKVAAVKSLNTLSLLN